MINFIHIIPSSSPFWKEEGIKSDVMNVRE